MSSRVKVQVFVANTECLLFVPGQSSTSRACDKVDVRRRLCHPAPPRPPGG